MTDSEKGQVRRPELVLGLVGPLGTDLAFVAQTLSDSLARVNYGTQLLRLSRLMREIPRLPWSELKDGPRDEEISAHIVAGNSLRKTLGRQDAMAMLGVGGIRELREARHGDPNKPVEGLAYIFYSLKRPEELQALRRIYGPALIIVAAYAAKSRRIADLAKRIAESRFSNQSTAYFPQAESLIQTDESEAGEEFGQDVEDTFALADIIINSSDRSSTTDSINRFVELLFGNSFHTPTRDEQGMYLAQGAAYRSASLARQVGAALCKVDGSLVAVGSNEVPTSGGGQYWPDDKLDGRDFRSGYDSSDRMRENLLAEILGRLQNGGWLAADKATMPVGQLVQEALRTGKPPLMKGAQFTSTIDFVRAVHAEMAALTDAARRGVATDGTILYTTTFPCHDCAKHVVASGVKRVVYIEPYTKSLVNELYSDSILVDSAIDCGDKVRFDPFVGIAPKRYSEFFALSKRRRKDASGAVLQWRPNEANPQLPDYMPSSVAILTGEEEAFKLFMDGMRSASLTA